MNRVVNELKAPAGQALSGGFGAAGSVRRVVPEALRIPVGCPGNSTYFHLFPLNSAGFFAASSPDLYSQVEWSELGRGLLALAALDLEL